MKKMGAKLMLSAHRISIQITTVLDSFSLNPLAQKCVANEKEAKLSSFDKVTSIWSGNTLKAFPRPAYNSVEGRKKEREDQCFHPQRLLPHPRTTQRSGPSILFLLQGKRKRFFFFFELFHLSIGHYYHYFSYCIYNQAVIIRIPHTLCGNKKVFAPLLFLSLSLQCDGRKWQFPR